MQALTAVFLGLAAALAVATERPTAADAASRRIASSVDQQRDEGEHVCRFCLKEFHNRMLLTMHVTEEHAEESEAVQLRGEDELKEEESVLYERLRQQRAKRSSSIYCSVASDSSGEPTRSASAGGEKVNCPESMGWLICKSKKAINVL